MRVCVTLPLSASELLFTAPCVCPLAGGSSLQTQKRRLQAPQACAYGMLGGGRLRGCDGC